MSKYETHKQNRDYVTKGELRKSRRSTRSESAPVAAIAAQMGVPVVSAVIRMVVR